MSYQEPEPKKGGGLIEHSFEQTLPELRATLVHQEIEQKLDNFPLLNTNTREAAGVQRSIESLKSNPRTPNLNAISPSTKHKSIPATATRFALQKELRATVNAAIKAELQRPEYQGFAAKAEVNAFIKASPHRPLIDKAVLAHIFTHRGAMGTQTAIRNKVSNDLPGMPVGKDWTKPLTSWMLKTARAQATGSGTPFNTIPITGKHSLSSLHKLARAAVAETRGVRHAYKAIITLDGEHVYINGHPFKISINRAKGRDYPVVRVGVEKLRDVLNKPIT